MRSVPAAAAAEAAPAATAAAIVWHLAHMVPYRVILVWIYNVTGRSMFAVVAFHAASNIGEVAWPFYGGEGYDPFVTAVLATVTAAILVMVWGPKTLGQSRSRGTPSLRL